MHLNNLDYGIKLNFYYTSTIILLDLQNKSAIDFAIVDIGTNFSNWDTENVKNSAQE